MNNKYKGVLLRDLLLDAGFSKRDLRKQEFKNLHLTAWGMDTDFQGTPFSVSIPFEKILDPANEIMLAYE